MNGMGRTLIGQLWQCWPLIGRSWCHAHCYDCWLQIILTHILTSIWKFHIHIYCLWDKNCVNPAKTNNPSVDQDSLCWQLVCLEWLSTLLIHDYDILMFYASIQTVWSEVVMRPRCNACDLWCSASEPWPAWARGARDVDIVKLNIYTQHSGITMFKSTRKSHIYLVFWEVQPMKV